MQVVQSESCVSFDGQELKEYALSSDEYAEIMDIQTDMMKLISAKASKEAILSQLCTRTESYLPNSVASIMLLDKESGFLDVCSAPSIPEEGIEALNGLCPGPGGGSCGNVIYKQEEQYVSAIKSDKRWDDLRDLADAFGLAACWSRPVRTDENEIIGTFALSSFEERTPSDFHKSLLAVGAIITNVVLSTSEENVA
ncbi:MAG TPA: hypothetical protein ENK65_00460 [Helicobacteraceae bacterium]|nr:hypothetical protein [Helicobacteraceae bacterium]